MLPHIDKENQETFTLSLKENLNNSIVSEWKKIDDNQVTAFYISNSVDTAYIKNKLGASNNFIFQPDQRFVIVKALSKNDPKYVYFYPYRWDSLEKQYKLDIQNMIFSKSISDSIYSLLKMGELDDIKWYKIKIN